MYFTVNKYIDKLRLKIKGLKNDKKWLLNFLLENYDIQNVDLKSFIKNNLESRLELDWMKIDAVHALCGRVDKEFQEILETSRVFMIDFAHLLSEIVFVEIEKFARFNGLSACLEWFKEITPILDLFFYDSKEWKNRMEFHLYKSCCLHRIHSVFDIITDYPNTIDSINDLKVFSLFKKKICMARFNQKEELLLELEKSVNTRLLQPAASTQDILSCLINIFGFLEEMKQSINISQASFIDNIYCYLR